MAAKQSVVNEAGDDEDEMVGAGGGGGGEKEINQSNRSFYSRP